MRKMRLMEIENLSIIIVVLILIGLSAALTYESMKPYKKVDKEDVYKYSGDKVETNIKVIKEIKDSTELEFIMFVPISNGKNTLMMPIPIFENYRVFKTDSSLYLAFDGQVPSIDRKIVVKGDVDHDEFGDKFVIKVSGWSYADFEDSE